MTLLLITKTAIIKQIFNLVASKLDIDLTILDVNIVSAEFDIVLIEDILFDDKFPTQDYAKRFGIITKNKEEYKDKSDFLLSKPFLPSILLTTIEKQLQAIITTDDTPANILDELNMSNEGSKEIDEEDEIEHSEEFINTLVEDISDEILEESDESVVSAAFVNNGGILDSNELSKIQDILNNDDIDTNDMQNNNINNTTQTQEDDWIDLADIIDKAIDEVREYQFDKKEPIKLMLNDYSMNEVSGLLNKLDQNIIDALVSGEEITLKLKVEK